jgi:hypothetical protein
MDAGKKTVNDIFSSNPGQNTPPINEILIRDVEFNLRKNISQSIQNFIKETLKKMFNNGLIPSNELQKLYDKQYCKETFHIEYPLIVDDESKTFDNSGRSRYWRTYKIGGHYVCSEWWKQFFPLYEHAWTNYIEYIAKLNN